MRGLPLALLAAAVAAGGCECLGADVDGGVDAGPDQCDYDTFSSPVSAGAAMTVTTLPLTCPVGMTAGVETEGLICPGGDDDWYRFTVGAGLDIVQVRVRNTTPLTNVDLSYTLYSGDGTVVVPNGNGSDSDGSDGVTCVVFNHSVTPGQDYYIVVRDEDLGAGEADDSNPYLLGIGTAADPDPYERNDDSGTATAVTPGTPLAGATIGYKGDEDWYSFTAGASDAIQIDLDTSTGSPVDLHFRLQDSAGIVFAEGGDADGSDGPTMLSELRGLMGAGTYYLIVTDEGESESDLAMTYGVALTLVTNPDTNEPNNTPGTATTMGAWTTGGPLTFNDTGRLFTPGDSDWFAINTSGATGRGVMEVTVNAGAGIPVLVSIISTDVATPCASGSGDCQTLTTTCPYTIDPDDFEWLDCPSFVCDMTPEPDACGAAGECLSGPTSSGCGYVQVARGPGTVVSTSAPVFVTGTATYIRIAAAMPGDFDLANDYTITVSIRNEPDPGEEDGYYFPNLVQTQFGLDHDEIYASVLSRAFDVADTVPARAVTLGVPVSGYISYEGDIDVWVLPDPCPAQDCGYEFTFNFPAGDVEYKVFAHRDPGSLNCSFGSEAEPMGSTVAAPASAGGFGHLSGDCCYFSVQEAGAYHIVVRDHNFNDWEWGTPYTFTINAVGVGAACTVSPTPGMCMDPPNNCTGNPCCPPGCCSLAYAEGCGCT